MAVIKSLGSATGERMEGVSSGVGGNEAAVVDTGVGRDGYAEGGAMGSVRESRFVLREAVEPEREGRPSVKSPCRAGEGDGGAESSTERETTEACLSWPPP